MAAISEMARTSFSSSNFPACSSRYSNSKDRSKWSSMVRFPRPVMIRMSRTPASTASSTTYWMAGLSTRGSISFGCDLVAGRNLVPRPAAGMTAFLTFIASLLGGRSLSQEAETQSCSPSETPRAGDWRRRTYNQDMPTYEYLCQSCGTHVEVFQRFSDEPLTECGICGGPLRKVFHPAGILFKGPGFYSTDSRSKAGAASKGG